MVLSAATEERSLPVTAAEGAEPLDGVADSKGWQFRMRFPDRAALTAYRDRCRGQDVSFTLHDLYVHQDDAEQITDTTPVTSPSGGDTATDD